MSTEAEPRVITIERPRSSLCTGLRILGFAILVGGTAILIGSFTAGCYRGNDCLARDAGRSFSVIAFALSLTICVVMYVSAFAIEVLLSIEALMANVADSLDASQD